MSKEFSCQLLMIQLIISGIFKQQSREETLKFSKQWLSCNQWEWQFPYRNKNKWKYIMDNTRSVDINSLNCSRSLIFSDVYLIIKLNIQAKLPLFPPPKIKFLKYFVLFLYFFFDQNSFNWFIQFQIYKQDIRLKQNWTCSELVIVSKHGSFSCHSFHHPDSSDKQLVSTADNTRRWKRHN